MTVGFIVWTRKFVGFGDKTEQNKNMKNKLLFYYINRTARGSSKMMSFFFHTQVECVFKCAFKMELKSGDTQISDPLAIIPVIYFVETLLNVQETSISYQK